MSGLSINQMMPGDNRRNKYLVRCVLVVYQHRARQRGGEEERTRAGSQEMCETVRGHVGTAEDRPLAKR